GPDWNGQVIARQNRLVITTACKNIPPANREAQAKASPIIGQAVAVGDARNVISVLVVLDPQVAPAWAKARGIAASSMAELAEQEAVLNVIRRALPRVDTHRPRVQQ